MAKQQQRKDTRFSSVGKKKEKERKVTHEHGVGFLVHKDNANTVMGLQQAHHHPPEGRTFNIAILQVCAPTSDYDDNKINKLYDLTSYRMPLIRHRRRTFLLCEKNGMQKWARMLVKTGKAFVDPSAMMTQMREDSDLWSLPALTI